MQTIWGDKIGEKIGYANNMMSGVMSKRADVFIIIEYFFKNNKFTKILIFIDFIFKIKSNSKNINLVYKD